MARLGRSQPTNVLLVRGVVIPAAGGSAVALASADANGASTAAGTLTEAVALVGQANGASGASGALTEAVALAGTSAGLSTATGALVEAVALTATAAGSSSAVGTLSVKVALAGQSSGVATTSATLSTGGFVYGSFGTHLGTPEFYGVLPGESWHDAAYRWWTGFPY